MAISAENLETIIEKLIENKKDSYLEGERPENVLGVVLKEIGHETDDLYNEKELIERIKGNVEIKNNPNEQSIKAEQEAEAERLRQEAEAERLRKEAEAEKKRQEEERKKKKPTTLQITTNPTYTFVDESGGYYNLRTQIEVTNNADWNLAHLSIRATIYSDTGVKVGEIRMFDAPVKAGETKTMYSTAKLLTTDVTNTNFTYELSYPNWWYEGDSAQMPESGGF